MPRVHHPILQDSLRLEEKEGRGSAISIDDITLLCRVFPFNIAGPAFLLHVLSDKMAHTIVEYMHEHGGYRCGYCGGSDSNYSHGMWAHSLTSEDYQDLMDRGWRRSGCYLYKPLMDKMCCPCYSIRCAALDFKPSKSNKKVIKKMIRFLRTGERPSSNPKSSEDTTKGEDREACLGTSEHPAQEKELRKRMTQAAGTMGPNAISANPSSSAAETIGCGHQSDSRTNETYSGLTDDRRRVEKEMNSETGGEGSAVSVKNHPKPGQGPDPSKPPRKKAKELRWQRRLERRSQMGTDAPPADTKQPNQSKSLEELIQEVESASEGGKHKLEMRYVRSSPMSPQFERTFTESYSVYYRYQTTIHRDPPTKPSKKQFKRFLVDSPMREEHLPGAPECGYGSFHEHFLLDGKIIAVGVLDILPGCVSSVYFYYDPDYNFLSLGTYSALRELEFTRRLHLEAPKINHYYLGFYIHSCIKMQYKGQYHPSFLLCPETYNWCPIKKCRPKLDVSKYSRLDDTDAACTADTPVTLQDVQILHMQMSMRYPAYQRFSPNANDEEEVLEYAQFVGKTCAGRILLHRM